MSYDINSIQSLDFRTGVRTRIPMYLGTDDNEGTYQAFKEILNNSTDESIAGYGEKIEIEVDETNNVISINDFGRGVPFGVRKNGENVLVSIYTKSHTGGKFDSNSYKSAAGLNGIGGSCVCLSSSFFNVISRRGGKMATANFEEGVLKNYKEGKTKLQNGTYVEFSPDPKVFKNGKIGYSFDRICSTIEEISYLYPKVSFKVKNRNDNTEKEYHSENGICDYIKAHLKKPLHKTILYHTCSDGTDSVEVAFQWGSKEEASTVFANGLICPEGGAPITGARSALTRVLKTLSGESFDSEIIRRNLTYVINCKVAAPSFANQTKSKINNSSLRVLTSDAFTSALTEMKKKYNDEFNLLITYLKKISKAEEAANVARNAILNQEKKETDNKKKRILMPEKFKDCEVHGEDSVLIICEGNSALSGLAPARDIEHEALFAIRGKIKNLLKAPLEECLENQEVSDIISILGCGIQDKYSQKKLNYGKLLIATDGDSDGYAIMCLISTMIYSLMPKFIEEKRLGWLRAPLFKIEKGKNKYFAYDAEELKELKNKINGEQTRIKGLGELSDADMAASMLHPSDRRIDMLTTADMEETGKIFQLLMGGEVGPRKDFLFDNADFESVML